MSFFRKVCWVRICFGKETHLTRVSCILLHSHLGTEWISFHKVFHYFKDQRRLALVKVCLWHSQLVRSSRTLTPQPREKSTTVPTSPVRKWSQKDPDFWGSHASLWWPQIPGPTAVLLTTTQEQMPLRL